MEKFLKGIFFALALVMPWVLPGLCFLMYHGYFEALSIWLDQLFLFLFLAGFLSMGLSWAFALAVLAVCISLLFSLTLSFIAAPVLTIRLLGGTMTPEAVILRSVMRWGILLLSFAAGFGIFADVADFADLMDLADVADVADVTDVADGADIMVGGSGSLDACIPEQSGLGCGPMDETYGLPSEVDGDLRTSHWVEGYQRSNGSWVDGYWKSRSG